jgi:hypothetical protein
MRAGMLTPAAHRVRRRQHLVLDVGIIGLVKRGDLGPRFADPREPILALPIRGPRGPPAAVRLKLI